MASDKVVRQVYCHIIASDTFCCLCGQDIINILFKDIIWYAAILTAGTLIEVGSFKKTRFL
jgi:hypothetical protein